jgi:hypothetical protein
MGRSCCSAATGFLYRCIHKEPPLQKMNPRRAAASEDLETVEASIDQIVASIKTNGNLGLRRTEQNLVDLTRLVLEEDEEGG